MLSKQIFSPTKSLFMAAGIAACGLATVSQSANALSVNLTTAGPSTYEYELVANPGDSWNVDDTLVFENLGNVTTTNVSGGAAFFFNNATSTGVMNEDIVFTAINGFTAGGTAQTFFGTFTIESTNASALVDWSLANDNASVQGPASTVPFEFSPGLGLILSGTLLGGLRLRSKFGKKEEINL